MKAILSALQSCVIVLVVAICSTATPKLYATEFTVKVDNDVANGHNTACLTGWEETMMLSVNAPCLIKKISVYYDGTTANDDTLWIVGDPSEGAVPPSSWVWPYNVLGSAHVVHYDGKPGWRVIDVSADSIRKDGYDRLVVQHRVQENGPWFGIDNNGRVSPSFLLDPAPNPNFYNIAGTLYYYSSGDFMVRAIVEYEQQKSDGSPAAQPEPTLVDVTKEVGMINASNAVFGSARVSVVDYDNDGWDDVMVGSTLYHNNHGVFEKVQTSIVAGGGSVWGDFDNDGYIDCYAVNGGAGDKIYRQLPDHSFVDVTASTKITNPAPTVTPMCIEFNNDSKLDLFIANGRTADSQGNETYFDDKLWLNNGDGTFKDITVSSGITAAEHKNYNNSPMDCWAASPGDYNGDGLVDIFVADYRLMPDRLYKNNGDLTFSDVSESTGTIGVPTAQAGYFGHGAGCDWGDFDNDGDLDLIVGNLGHPDSRGAVSNPSLIFRNDGNVFTEVHQKMGLKFFEMNFGAMWLDLNCDGFLDLFHCQYAYNAPAQDGAYRRSRTYLNQGPSKSFAMKDITWSSGAAIHGAWTCARLDYDNDGDEDIIAASPTDAIRVFRNDMKREGQWLELSWPPAPSSSAVNSNMYGARVTVYCGSDHYMRELSGGGYGSTASQNSNVLHFGLANHQTIDSVVVRRGATVLQRWNALHVNTRYALPLTQSQAPVAILTTPQLQFPTNNSISNPQQLQLNWTACGTAASYQIQLADNAALKASLVFENNDGSITSSQSLINGATYFWRVRSCSVSPFDSSKASPWSTTFAFSVGIPKPSVPVLLSPANGTVNFKPKPLGLLNWNSSVYISKIQPELRYHVQVSEDSTFTMLFRDTSGLSARSLSMKGAKGSTKYWWRVRAENDGGATDWSSVWTLTTIAEVSGLENGSTDEASLQVYPLPASNIIHINASCESGVASRLEIHSEDGRLVYKRDFNDCANARLELDVPVASWATGLYTCSVHSSSETRYSKIQIIH